MATVQNALSLTSGSANIINSFKNQTNIISILDEEIGMAVKSIRAMYIELDRGTKADGIRFLSMELEDVVKSANAAVDSFEELHSVSEKAVKNAEGSTTNIKNKVSFGEKLKGYGDRLNGYVEKVKGVAGNLGPLVKSGMDMADKYALQNYQLDSIAQNGETSEQLRQKVYSTAQRSRTGYDGTLSTVTKLAKYSKDDFRSNDEIIYFTELMNKAFSGLGADEAAKSIEKVTDAMVNGKIKGDELKAIMEKSPILAQALTTYTGQSQEKLAVGPGISDDVLKNAMFNSSEDINAKFQQMPVTFAQIGTLINDTLTNALGPLLEAVANAAMWIYDNWSVVEPIFWGIAGAVAAVTIAQLAMNLALLACPLTWIALAIGAVIGLIAYWIQSVGGIKVAWLIVVNAILTVWDIVKIAFFIGVYGVIDLWNNMMLGIKSASVGIQNFIGDMKVGVLNILQGMVNGAIDIINDFTNLLNNITGGSIETIAHVTFGTEAQLKNDAEKKAREAELDDQRSKVAEVERQHQKDILEKMLKAASDKKERDKEISSLGDEAKQKAKEKDATKKYSATAFSGNGITENTNSTNLAATAANTGAMKNSMDIAEENLVYMRDVAERDAINKFTTSEISVNMGGITNNVNSELDLDGVVSYMEQKVYETMTVAAEGVYK